MKALTSALLGVTLILTLAQGSQASAKSCCDGGACCNGQSCCHKAKK